MRGLLVRGLLVRGLLVRGLRMLRRRASPSCLAALIVERRLIDRRRM
jgi:hypothetical protein